MNFTDSFKAARQVSTPLICVRTPDPASTVRNLSVAAADIAKLQDVAEPPVLMHDVCRGLTGFNDKGKQEAARLIGNTDQKATIPPAGFLKTIEKAADDAVIFMANGHKFWNEPVVVQAIWNLRDVFKQKGSTLVIMATFGATLPIELTQDVLILDEPLPTEGELAEIVNDTFHSAGAKKPNTETVTKAVSALVGLAAFPAEETTARCLTPKGLDMFELWERKRQIIEQIRGLTVWRGGETFADLGGLDNAKSYFSRMFSGPERPDGIVFTDEIEKVFAGFGTDTSGTTTKSVGAILSYMEDRKIAGSLFLGPAGSGKSALAKAMGNEAGIPTVQADFSAMETSLVGATGENVRAALAIITAMFRKPLFIATCNRFGGLPPELRRRYWLPTFFFDLPTTEERKLIWPIQMKAFEIAEQKLPIHADRSTWTGAEIRNCCRNAHNLSCSLTDAAEFIVPVSISDEQGIKELRQSATGKFISAGAPGMYRLPDDISTPKQSRKIRSVVQDDRDYN